MIRADRQNDKPYTSPGPVLIEACVDSVLSAIAAERAGADRLELCAALADGGVTPSAGMIEAVLARVRIPVFVLIRPRGGGFVYSPAEFEVMLRDIARARLLGVQGIVTGVLTASRHVDGARTRALVEAAECLPVTFHRAIDWTPDLSEALEAVIAAGAARVLTSGGRQTAREGADAIGALVRQAAGRIAVMAGGGIREESIQEIVTRSGVTEVHLRCAGLIYDEGADDTLSPPAVRLRKPFPDDEIAREETDEARLRACIALLRHKETTDNG